MRRSLLPAHATAVEVALEEAMRGELSFPVDFARLYDADTCPERYLGYLAWHVSVEVWDDTWPVERRRAVIRASSDVHRRKGTATAIRAALAPFEAGWDISPWFDHGGPPYTFRVETTAASAIAAPSPPTTATIRDIRRAVTSAKPVRAHFSIRLRQETEARAELRVGTRIRRRLSLTHTPLPRPIKTPVGAVARTGTRIRALWRAVHDAQGGTA